LADCANVGTGDGLESLILHGSLRTLVAAAGLAAATSAAVYGIYLYQHRFVRTNADLLQFLPPGDNTTFFVHVDALRRAGVLKLLTGTAVMQESEYQGFLNQTNFDYARDVDAMAGAIDGDQLFFLLRGRFQASKLKQYALSHGGTCTDAECRAETSDRGRWAVFHFIQPDTLVLAVGPNQKALDSLRRSPKKTAQLPTDPVWVKLSGRLLRNPAELPFAFRVFAVSLQSAAPVTVSLGPASGSSVAAFTLQLDASCPNQAAAETIRKQLEIQTKMLKLELARERKQPNAADLTGMLVAGSFQVVDQHLVGRWPVQRELIESLQ
jgi:hypothetical protein